MKFSFLEKGIEPGSSDKPLETFPDDQGPVGVDWEWIGRCRGYLEQLGLEDLSARVCVEWNSRMRSAAGRAIWPQGLIQLNPRLVAISDSEVRRTVLHELAHLVAYERNPSRPIKGHGREWQLACADLGIPGENATHRLELPSRKIRRRWRYACGSCGSVLDRVRRFKGAVACYECCRRNNGGAYSDQFRLVEQRLD